VRLDRRENLWVDNVQDARRYLAKTGDGLVAIAATFVSYGVSEILQC